MTEATLRDLAHAIVGLRESLRARAPRLAAIAARLREAEPPLGMEDEAQQLEDHAAEMLAGLDAIAKYCDGMLDDTQVMSLDELADDEG